MHQSISIVGWLAPLFLLGSGVLIQADSPADTPNAEVLYGQGVHAFFGGAAARAIPLLEKAVELEPEDPRPWFFLGLCALRTGETEEANRFFRTGADLEQKPSANLYDVPGALERIQGAERWILEQHRIAARRRWEKMEARRLKQRYGQIKQASRQIMQEQIDAAESEAPPAETEPTEPEILRSPFGAKPIQPFEEPKFVDEQQKKPEEEMTEEEMMEGVVLEPTQSEEEAEPEMTVQQPTTPQPTETTNPFEMGGEASPAGGDNPFGDSTPAATEENPFGQGAPAASGAEPNPFGENAGPAPMGGGPMNFFSGGGPADVMQEKPTQQFGGMLGSGLARLIGGKSESDANAAAAEPFGASPSPPATSEEENPFGATPSEPTESPAPGPADENPFGGNPPPASEENPFDSSASGNDAAPVDEAAGDENPFGGVDESVQEADDETDAPAENPFGGGDGEEEPPSVDTNPFE